ncbi:hypothetical protein EBQ74_05970 [bacterium]|nr:hypothetical protein [bacterium]
MLDLFFNSTLEAPLPAIRETSQLLIVGTPLSDNGLLSLEAIDQISKAQLIIAESKKNAFRYLKQAKVPQGVPLFFLDNIRDKDWADLTNQLKTLAQSSARVVLFSDTGMPLLFDPGAEVLNLARSLKYEVHSVPSATSWGSACALSGWNPPFLVYGFLPRDLGERKQQLSQLKLTPHHTVLMDTPYRFEALLSQIAEVFGNERELFLAWEISKSDEQLLWGSVRSIQREAEKKGLKKGEFVIIIHGASRVK